MQPINVFFKPSFLLAGIFAGVAALALLVLWLMPLMWWVQVLLSLMVILHTCLVIRNTVLLMALNSVNTIAVNHQQQLSIYQNNGSVHNVEICNQTFVSVYLTVLRFKKLGKGRFNGHYTVLITPLNTHQNSFRQLRVWLKWRKVESL